MKTRKRLLAMLMALAMVFALAACSNGTGETSDPGADSSAAGGEGEAYVVGICQQATHDALDAATQGFKDALTEAFGEGGVTFREGNAANDFTNSGTIVNGFLAEGVDLILANGTTPLQAAAAATADVPILGTSVTNYETALGTVGVTTGITPALSPFSQILLTGLMYLGRVGVFSVSVAFLTRGQGLSRVKYPNLDVMIG